MEQEKKSRLAIIENSLIENTKDTVKLHIWNPVGTGLEKEVKKLPKMPKRKELQKTDKSENYLNRQHSIKFMPNKWKCIWKNKHSSMRNRSMIMPSYTLMIVPKKCRQH